MVAMVLTPQHQPITLILMELTKHNNLLIMLHHQVCKYSMTHMLDALGLTNDTVVSFVGDHGQQVGEHNLWEKMTNFELGVRIPMIIRAPWYFCVATTAFCAFLDPIPLCL